MAGSLQREANFRFIITGGPGSGKTTLVEALRDRGYQVFPEIARDLITKGMTPPIQGAKPDSSLFFELILSERIKSHQAIKGAETGFYDRGIPDSLGYFAYLNIRVPRALSAAVENYHYNPIVFAAPPWEDIFTRDQVRRESFAEACRLYELTVNGYLKCGYRIVVLGKVAVGERVAEIESWITGPQNGK
jgi:predicted ATPase